MKNRLPAAALLSSLLVLFTLSCQDSPRPSDQIDIDLAYDDGTSEVNSATISATAGGQIGVVFTAPEYPATIRMASFFVSDACAPTTAFKVNVYAFDGTSISNVNLLTANVTAAAASGNTWVDVDLTNNNLVVSGDFCLAMEWLTATGSSEPYTAQWLGCDTSGTPNRRSWWKFTGYDWQRVETVGTKGDRNNMIRVVIEGQ
jgi:hypothetical protein